MHIVSPKCFRPRPKVESAIVHFPLRENPELDRKEREIFFELVRAAFGQRRKKVINALASLSGSLLPGKELLLQLLQQSGIRPDSRAETISIESYMQLALLVAKSQKT